MSLYEMAQSVLAEKTQWYAGETVVLHKTEHARAVVRECDGLLCMSVCVVNHWGPQITVGLLNPVHGWRPCNSFNEQTYRSWAERTKKALGIR